MDSNMKHMFLYAWQFPQNICGVVALNIYRPNRVYILENGVEIYYSSRIRGGVTFGRTCIIAASHYRLTMEESLKRDTVRHNAIGHTRQSRLLGWFYFPVLGASLLLGKILGKQKYQFGMEKWADKIANVER